VSRESESTLTGVRLMRPNRLLRALSLGLPALMLLGILAGIVTKGLNGPDVAPIINLAVLSVLGGGFATWWTGRAGKKPSEESYELRATGNGIYLSGKRLVAKKDIKTASLWPGRGAGAIVRVQRRGLGAPIDLQVKDAVEGRKLIETLGFSAGHVASTHLLSALSMDSLKSRVRGTYVGAGVLLMSFLGAMLGAKLGLGPPAIAIVGAGLLFHVAMVLRYVRPGKITVGADGVHVQWASKERFIPTADIVRAEVVETTWGNLVPMLLRIHTRSGEPIDLVGHVGRQSAFGRFNDAARAHAEVLAERVNEAVNAHVDEAPASLAWDDGLLARGEREVSEWVAALRRIEDKVQTFRERAAVDDVFDRLWRILEDVTATPDRRAAAAVALSPHLDEGGRERVRIAAQATATPKLRIALEAAAADDDDRLIRALDEVSELEARSTTGRTTTR
jgi:hypothetical protein